MRTCVTVMIPIALATCLVFQQVKAGPIYQGPQHQRVQRSASEEEYETPGESLGEFVEEDLRSGENGDAEGLSKDPQVVDTGVEFLISNGQVPERTETDAIYPDTIPAIQRDKRLIQDFDSLDQDLNADADANVDTAVYRIPQEKNVELMPSFGDKYPSFPVVVDELWEVPSAEMTEGNDNQEASGDAGSIAFDRPVLGGRTKRPSRDVTFPTYTYNASPRSAVLVADRDENLGTVPPEVMMFDLAGSQDPDRENSINTGSVASNRRRRPQLVRQDAFDLSEEDEEAELRRIKYSVDRLLAHKVEKKKIQKKYFRPIENDGGDFRQYDADPPKFRQPSHEGRSNMQKRSADDLSPLDQKTLRENDGGDFRELRDTEKSSRTDDGDEGRLGGLEEETTVQLPPLNLSEAERVETSEDGSSSDDDEFERALVRLLADQEAHEKAATREPGENELVISAENGATDIEPVILSKRSYPDEDQPEDQFVLDYLEDPRLGLRDAPDLGRDGDQLIISAEDAQLPVDEQSGYGAIVKREASVGDGEVYRKFRRYPKQLRQPTDFDAKSNNGDLQFEKDDLRSPEPEKGLQSSVTGRFRVCDMSSTKFYKGFSFTGKTLEVDECYVTCERRDDSDRVFSHIFKLVDWPCGARLEGKCDRDGVCSAFV